MEYTYKNTGSALGLDERMKEIRKECGSAFVGQCLRGGDNEAITTSAPLTSGQCTKIKLEPYQP